MNYIMLAIAVIYWIFCCILMMFGKGKRPPMNALPKLPPPPKRYPHNNGDGTYRLDKSQAPDPKTISPPKPKPKD